MVTELLILSVLLEEESTIYKLKKKIENLFSFFLTPSHGTLYPALKNLEAKKFVGVKRKISTGGQKSSFYSITKSGKNHFENLMLKELPENPATAYGIIKVKLFCLNQLDKKYKITLINDLVIFYEKIIVNAESFLSGLNLQEKTTAEKINANYIKHFIRTLYDEVEWLQRQSLM